MTGRLSLSVVTLCICCPSKREEAGSVVSRKKAGASREARAASVMATEDPGSGGTADSCAAAGEDPGANLLRTGECGKSLHDAGATDGETGAGCAKISVRALGLSTRAPYPPADALHS